MKIGFSSLVCPGWSLQTILDQASALGFQGVELRGLQGEFDLMLAPELAGRPESVKDRFSEKKIELVCLGVSASLTVRKKSDLARQRELIIDGLELAARLSCPFVRLFAGEVERGDTPESAMARAADLLQGFTTVAARTGVTLLVENGGDFSSSQSMWFLLDAVGHPAVQCCWNQGNAKIDLERPTVSIPRLAGKIGLVHLCDGHFDDAGVLSHYTSLGEGNIELARQIELLRGIGFGGYLMCEWPKAWVDSLPSPEAALPQAAAFLQSRVAEKQAILSAYKGDKNAPRYSPDRAAATSA